MRKDEFVRILGEYQYYDGFKLLDALSEEDIDELWDFLPESAIEDGKDLRRAIKRLFVEMHEAWLEERAFDDLSLVLSYFSYFDEPPTAA